MCGRSFVSSGGVFAERWRRYGIDTEPVWRAPGTWMERHCGRDGNDWPSVWCRAERCGEAWIGFAAQLRAWCTAAGFDHRRSWIACMGNSPVIRRGCFFVCGESSAWGPWALVVWAAGRTWRGHGIGTVRGWRAFFGGMGPCSSDMGVAICEDVAGFGRPAVRRKAGSVRSAHGSADPWPFFGMDV